mmetsp:Transcript_1838/g.3542  ORF Transcript_1838/g.3542 Transcript_1838/m.3542 type:complete len:199 (+) Transcript_1838:38-634(+)|eukprot:scaffold936_cov106-Amphora_coffeaeformis.AAC.22
MATKRKIASKIHLPLTVVDPMEALEGLLEDGTATGTRDEDDRKDSAYSASSGISKQAHSMRAVSTTTTCTTRIRMLHVTVLWVSIILLVVMCRQRYPCWSKDMSTTNTPPRTDEGQAPVSSQCYTDHDGGLMIGTDVSEVFMVQDGGGLFRYRNGTLAASGLDIVRHYGYCYARVRIMVDPVGTYGLVQDLDHVLRLA